MRLLPFVRRQPTGFIAMPLHCQLSTCTAGVPADCPIKFHPIPASSGSAPCSGHGAPVAALGTCQCYVGYDGAVCAACADGYQRISGVCQRTLTSFKAQAALAAIAQSNAANQKVQAPFLLCSMWTVLYVHLCTIVWCTLHTKLLATPRISLMYHV